MMLSRRYFFFGSLLAGAVPKSGFGSTPSLKTLGYKSPNERLNIASVGSAGRAFEDMTGCDGENIVAIADVDDTVAAPAYRKYEKAARYRDFRKMLDKEGNNIDAVIVACPDHMHAMAALWAMARGKHVYVEKPLARTVAECRMLTEAAAKHKVATQMGNQGYSNEGARVAAEILWSGEIGDVKEVHAWTSRPMWPQGITEIPKPEPVPSTLDWDLWLGIAPYREFTSGGAAYANNTSRTYGPNITQGFYLPFNWRGFYDFGTGPLGDMACHILGAPHMALRLGAPSSVECLKKEGTSPIQFPKKSVTRFEFPARGKMPPVTLYWYDAATGPMYRPAGIPEDEPLIGGAGAFGRTAFPGGRGPARAAAPSAAVNQPASGNAPAQGGATAQPAATGGPARAGGGFGGREGVVFVGEKGHMTTDTYGATVRLLPQARHEAYKLPPQMLTRSPGHHRDWIRACKGGEPGCSNFSVAGPFAEWIAMGVIALRVEGKLEWDSEKMRFRNSAEANRLVQPYVRKGWSLT
jgi:hypothetical protein